MVNLFKESNQWIVYALISPALWAIVHIADAYCVRSLFTKPWICIVTSSLATLVTLPIFFLATTSIDFKFMPANIIILSAVGSLCYVVSQYFCFTALKLCESGIVAAYWNILPVILLIPKYFFDRSLINLEQILGAAIIIISSFGFFHFDKKGEARWVALWRMILGVIFQACFILIAKHLFGVMPQFQFFLVTSFLIGIIGLLPLALKGNRSDWRNNRDAIHSSALLLITLEFVNLLAVSISEAAFDKGIPTLVASVESTLPAYVFLMSSLLYLTTGLIGEKDALVRWKEKMSLIVIMMSGVILIGQF